MTNARRNAFEAMISKQQQQLNREQQAELRDKLLSRGGTAFISNRRRSAEKYAYAANDADDFASQERNTNQNYEEGDASLSSRCDHQGEEIRKLHEQLQQREVDLKEMRCQYIIALKGKRDERDLNFNYKADRDDSQTYRTSEAKKSNRLHTYDTDDNYSSSTSNLVKQSFPSSSQYKDSDIDTHGHMQRDPKEEGSDIRSRQTQPIRDTSCTIDNKRINYATSSSSFHSKPGSSHGRGSAQERDLSTRDSQVIDLIEFRDTATKEYEKLRIAYGILQAESEEKRCIVEETCGRLIRFVSGEASERKDSRNR